MTLFSQTAEIQANFSGDLKKLKDLHVDRDVAHISMSGDITVTPGFTMLLVQGLVELNESGIVALELTPANDDARDLLVKLVELLSPPVNADIDEEKDEEPDSPQSYLSYNWMDYNCGIAKSDWFSKFNGSCIVTIPAGNDNIPDFLGGINGLSQNQSRPLLFLLLFTEERVEEY
jgi:hypothetical protein